MRSSAGRGGCCPACACSRSVDANTKKAIRERALPDISPCEASERKSRGELHLPRNRVAHVRDHTEGRRAQRAAWHVEDRRVGEVVDFPAQLQPSALRQGDVLEK